MNQDSATGGKSGGAGSNHLLGVHNPALYRVSYAPVKKREEGKGKREKGKGNGEQGTGNREYRRRESNPHGHSGPRRSERRAYAFRHGGMMAPAGIEPATRWISPSRSTGELQEPGTKPTGFEPALSRETVGCAALRHGFSCSGAPGDGAAERMTSPPGSRVTTREPAIRRRP